MHAFEPLWSHVGPIVTIYRVIHHLTLTRGHDGARVVLLHVMVLLLLYLLLLMALVLLGLVALLCTLSTSCIATHTTWVSIGLLG